MVNAKKNGKRGGAASKPQIIGIGQALSVLSAALNMARDEGIRISYRNGVGGLILYVKGVSLDEKTSNLVVSGADANTKAAANVEG